MELDADDPADDVLVSVTPVKKLELINRLLKELSKDSCVPKLTIVSKDSCVASVTTGIVEDGVFDSLGIVVPIELIGVSAGLGTEFDGKFGRWDTVSVADGAAVGNSDCGKVDKDSCLA